MKMSRTEQYIILNRIKNHEISWQEGHELLMNLKSSVEKSETTNSKVFQLSPFDYPPLRDHVIKGLHNLTFDGFLDLALKFLFDFGNKLPLCFRDIKISNPIYAKGTENIDVQVDFNPQKLSLEIFKANSRNLNEGNCFSLRIFPDYRFEEKKYVTKLNEINLKTISRDKIFEYSDDIHIGDFYKNISQLKHNGQHGEYLLTLSENSLNKELQVLNSIIFGSIRFVHEIINEPQLFVIPFAIKELCILDNFSKSKNYTAAIEISERAGNIIKVNVSIFDENNNQVVDCKGLKLSVKRLSESNQEKLISAEDIAIIGVSARFPGCESIGEFWDLLSNGKTGISEVPKNRWDIDSYYDPDPNNFKKTYCRKGGFLNVIDEFDARFFSVSAKEAELTDPQQRIFLEESWRALEDAGLNLSVLNNLNCGVYVGVGQSDYQSKFLNSKNGIGPQAFWGNDCSVLASRISYFLNLKGPSLAINTACSSSLVSVHLACKSLLNSDCDVAIAGGVFIGATPNFYVVSSNANMLSPTGTCYAFDHRANGFVPGEGCGVVILKKLNKAIEDQDHIYAVIKSSAVNQDGKTNGITAPSMLAQTDVVDKALRLGKLNPESIGYIEAHGTGTPLGDPIEFEALDAVFKKYTNKVQFCALGSVKTNIGHAATAAGIASLIKTVLCLQHRKIVPSLNFEKENSRINLDNSAFYISTQIKEWNNSSQNPLRAGVSSFGFSGTNCHILLEEVPTVQIQNNPVQRDFLMPFSAINAEALFQIVDNIYHYISQNNVNIHDLSYTLCLRRSHFKTRVAFVVSSIESLKLELGRILNNKHIEQKQINKATENHFLSACYKAYLEGSPVNFIPLFENTNAACISLPPYPFQRKSYWINDENKMLSDGIVYFSKGWKLSNKVDQMKGADIPCIYIGNSGIGQEFNEILFTDKIVNLYNDDTSLDKLRASIESLVINKFKDLNVKQLNLILDTGIQKRDNHDSHEYYILNTFYINFFFIKYLLKETNFKTNIFYLYNSYCNLPYILALEGLSRSVGLENPRIALRIIETDQSYKLENIINIEVNSFHLEKNVALVRYVNNERYVYSIAEVVEKQSTEGSIELKTGKTYLITGGMGGIGIAIAKHLAQHYKSKLILLGRKNASAEISKQLEKIEQLGGTADYYPIDITDQSAVKNFRNIIHSNYGTIDGIFHCAGVLELNSIPNKDIEEIQRVLSPKIEGTLNLNNYLGGCVDEFIVYFSSIAAAFGALGQSDYAYANSFLDHLAINHTHQHLKIFSINWPLWSDGKMQANDDMVAYMNDKFGIRKIGMDHGMQIINRILKGSSNCIMPLYGDDNKIRNKLNISDHTKPKTLSQVDSRISAIDNQLEANLAVAILKIVSQETGLAIEEISEETYFEDLGMDSIMIKNLSQKLSNIVKDFPVTIIFESKNTSALVNNILEQCKENIILTDSETPSVEKVTKNYTPENKEVQTSKNSPDVAIIGVSGIFPKSKNIDEFWYNLKHGVDCVGEIPEEREEFREFLNEIKSEKNEAIYCKWGGFISEYKNFDPYFFHIAPREAEVMDPQERLLIQEVWHVLENAGYTRQSLSKYKVGVYSGVTNAQYQKFQIKFENYSVSPLITYASLANRISYLFDFSGPSLAIDTMCSSSLTALHYAFKSVQSGECDYAIAGSANLILHPDKYIQLSLSKFASKTGKCYSFSKKADGYIPGEGVCALLLKPLNKAIEDNDNVWGVLKGSSLNHGGKTNGYTVPNPKAQAGVIFDALVNSNINPEKISYIEAHGTGTQLGDPIEIQGLTHAFNKLTSQKQFCSIGSVKSNIGHLESAAGLAGVTKILLQLKYKMLVPSLYSDEINPNINFQNTPFVLQKKFENWPENVADTNAPRLAAISSFGAGGANCHVIIQEHITNYEIREDEKELILISAKTQNGLPDQVRNILSFVKTNIAQNCTVSLSFVEKSVLDILSHLSEIPIDQIEENEEVSSFNFDQYKFCQLLEKVKLCGLFANFEIALINSLLVKELISLIFEKSNQLQFNHFNLSDLAHTLQVGREHLKYKLAFIIESKQELVDVLSKWLENKALDSGLFYNNLEKIDKNELDKEEINKFLSSRDYEKLAEAWLIDKSIDWHGLKRKNIPKKIVLPGYVFSSETYWLKQVTEDGKLSNNKLHPLVDQNISSFESIKFSTYFTGNERFLKDHVLLDKKVLPGVAYIEIAHFSISHALSFKVETINNFIWKQVFYIDKPKLLITELVKDGDKIKCEFYSIDPKGDKVYHAQCLAKSVKITSDSYPLADFDIDIIKNNSLGILNPDKIYEYYKKGGLCYGNSYKLIKELYYNKYESLAYLEVPDEFYKEYCQYQIPPPFFDAAIQGGIGILGDNSIDSETTHIPYVLEEVKIFSKPDQRAYVYLKLSDNSTETTRRFDATIKSENGRVVAMIKGFTARVATRAKMDQRNATEKPATTSPSPDLDDAPENIYLYKPIWQELSALTEKENNSTQRKLLLFDSDTVLFDHLKSNKNIIITLVKPDTKFEIVKENTYSIQPGISDDYNTLFSAIDKTEIQPDIIVVNWYNNSDNASGLFSKQGINREKFESIYNSSIMNLYWLLINWSKYFKEKDAEIIIINKENQSIEDVFKKSLKGFVNSISIILPKAKMVFVDCDSANSALGNILTSNITDSYNKLRIINDKVYTQSFESVHLSEKTSVPIIEKGVYLILGAMGGIGRLLAQHLANNYEASLILIGKSKIDSAKQEIVNNLKKKNKLTEYYSCNISNDEEVSLLYKKVKAKYGHVNGIFHAAGIMSKKDLFHKTQFDFKSVMEAKIEGTLIVDQVFKNEKLDFIVLFSSTSSILGDYGRCDYSVSNNFLDHYAYYRNELVNIGKQHGKTFVIDWPLWKDGGMHMGSENAEGKLMKAMGLDLLKSDDGIQYLEKIISGSSAQVIVMCGKLGKIEELLFNEKNGNTSLENKTQSVKSLSQEKSSHFNNEYAEIVKNIICDLQKVNINNFDVYDKLDVYGFDSISIVEFTNRINSQFQTDLNPSLFFDYTTTAEIANYLDAIKKTAPADLIPASNVVKELKKEDIKNVSIIGKTDIDTIKPYLKECSRKIQQEDYSYDILEEITSFEEHIADDSENKLFYHMLVPVSESRVLEIFTIGSGPAVLLIPGFGVSSLFAYKQVQFLFKFYRVILIHLPGSGLSDPMPDLLFPPKVILPIHQALLALGIENASVIGFSLGGIFAQELVRTYPSNYSKLILSCSFTKTNSADTKEDSLENKFEKDFKQNKSYKKYWQLYLESKNVNKNAFKYLVRGAQLKAFDTTVKAKYIKVPTMILSGQKDAVVNPNESKIISDSIANSFHLTFLDGGHCCHITHPDTFNQIIHKFLKDNLSMHSFIDQFDKSNIKIVN